MEYIKNRVFLYLTKRQKSMLLSFLRSFAKKNSNLTKEDITDKFLEEEKYYLEINNPHFEFIADYFSDETFLSDISLFLDYVFYELKQKEALRPIIEKQKKFQKEQRKRANDFKMSKLPPTKKQLLYYEKLCKNRGIEPVDIKDATRLDVRNLIMNIIEPENEAQPDE